MKPIRISAVSYLNTLPFVYGIKSSGFLTNYQMDLDVPAVCAQKLITDKVDIGLVPVAVLPALKNYHLLTNYCIGACGVVRTVLLVSRKPVKEIKRIYLDFESRTSVKLIKVLSDNFWKIYPEWLPANPEVFSNIESIDAAVIIGDKTFEMRNHFPFVYDLAEEWQKFTGLPFVFACWTANKAIPQAFLAKFNEATAWGVSNIPKAIENTNYQIPKGINLLSYLQNDINYPFDESKKKALNLFLKYIA